MHFRSRPLILLAVAWVAVALVARTSAAEQAAAPQFQNGDSVCFIGDSITHGGRYHSEITLFYATRFPDRRFQAHNCGISGDSAAGAVRRYAWDIQPHKPTVATIMLGMNDVGRGSYGKDKVGPTFDKRRRDALNGYQANMTALAKLLHEAGCKTIFIAPSIYDQTGNQATENNHGVNDALGQCAQLGRELASRFQGSTVDFHSLMSKLNAEGQQRDPSFTIVGKDRVHPGEVGHLVMAYAFLKAQRVPAVVASMTVDAARPAVIAQINCTISGLKADCSAGQVQFECLEKALPFPVSAGAAAALELVPFMDDLNRETLVVTGLPEGDYELLIDGQPATKKSAAELAAGVNLAAIKTTPQYKQALRVRDLCDKRNALVAAKLRTMAAVRHFILDRASPPPADNAAERRLLDAQIEKHRKTKFDYGVMQIETYRKFKPDERQVAQAADDAWRAMYEENRPQPHSYVIRPAAGKN